jgi:uncharacterized membrane protein YraQ (UPF0718 family)
MKGSSIYMLLFLLALVAANYFDGGVKQVIGGAKDSWIFFITTLAFPLLMAVLITGQTQELVTHHKEWIETWVVGGWGIFGAIFAGAAAPLGITMLTTVRRLWEGGMVDKGILMTFLVSTTSTNLCQTWIRWPMLGGKVLTAYLIVGLVINIVTALFFWKFGKYVFR